MMGLFVLVFCTQLTRRLQPAHHARARSILRQLLRKIYSHYSHKSMSRSGSKTRADGQPSPRIKNGNAPGTTKIHRGPEAERESRLATLTLSFEGAKAFATDVGLVRDNHFCAVLHG